MLKVTALSESGILILKVEGKLAGPWVKELEALWRSSSGTGMRPMKVDLSAVSFIDAEGKGLLTRMYRGGAELLASDSLTRSIVEGIIEAERRRGTDPARGNGRAE